MLNSRSGRNTFPPGGISSRPKGAGSSMSPRSHSDPTASSWARLLRTRIGFMVVTEMLRPTVFRKREGCSGPGGTAGEREVRVHSRLEVLPDAAAVAPADGVAQPHVAAGGLQLEVGEREAGQHAIS